MENTVCIENMPLEILEHVASYLSINEILVCCATSTIMRQGFSSDYIWKKRCNLDVINYLKQCEPLVEPSFEWLELVEDDLSTLSPLSEWRKHYMLHASLLNNWRCGKFEKEQIEFGIKGAIYRDTRVTFYGSDYICLHTECLNQNTMIDELWDVGGTPFLHSIIQVNLHDYLGFDIDNNPRDGCQIIVGNKLVNLHKNLVLIFEISISSYSQIPLLNSFIINKSEEESRNLIGILKNAQLDYNLTDILTQTETIVCGHYLIGSATDTVELNNPKLHIWNIVTGEKIKEIILPLINGTITRLRFISSSNNKAFIAKLHVNRNRYMHHYFGFDITKLELSPFLLKVNYCDFVCFDGKNVIGVSEQQLYLYDYTTSEKVALKKLNYPILRKGIVTVGNTILCGTVENVVHILSISSLAVINTVKIGYTLYSLKSICNKFVVVNSINSEVWEMGVTAKKLFRFPNDGSLVAVNKSCTKLVIEKGNKLFILNFW